MRSDPKTRRGHAAQVAAHVAALASEASADQQIETILGTHDEDAGAGRTTLLAIEDITEFPWQARRHYPESEIESLAEHIELQGQLQPVRVRRLKGALVTKAAGGPTKARYQLVFGHRRLRAYRLLQTRAIAQGAPVPQIRAEVVELDDAEARLQNIAENEKRGGLSSYERALEVVGAIEVLRERLEGKEPTLRDLSPYFDGLTDQPLSYLRRIGEQFGDEQEFRAAGLIDGAGDVDWAAIHRLTADDLYEAAHLAPEDRARRLRDVARRRSAGRGSSGRASDDSSTVDRKPSRRGRRGKTPIATKEELLTTRRLFHKKLRAPFNALTPEEAHEHLGELLQAVTALAEVAYPRSPVVSLETASGGAIIYLPAGMTGVAVEALRAMLGPALA
jgi:ParB/RepB/Spo0J family partition protein